MVNIQSRSVKFLLSFNFAVFILGFVVQLLLGDIDNDVFTLLGGLSTLRVIENLEIWLLVTSNFFHLDVLHFAVNMFSLLRLGEVAGTYYGEKKVFYTYMLGGIGGSLLTVIVADFYWKFFDEPYVLSLGASGSIFAIIGLMLGGTLRKNKSGFDIPFTFGDILPITLLSLSVGFLPGLNINNWAHVGGLITGFLLGLILSNSFNPRISKVERYLDKFLFLVSIFLLALSYFALVAVILKTIFI